MDLVRTQDSTPEALRREERLQTAYLLLRSSRSVAEVADALGFRQRSQFVRDFRSRFGVLPSAVQALAPLVRSEGGAENPIKHWEPVAPRLELLSRRIRR